MKQHHMSTRYSLQLPSPGGNIDCHATVWVRNGRRMAASWMRMGSTRSWGRHSAPACRMLRWRSFS